MDLVYSEDDGGYYWQRSSDWKVSQVFETKEQAFSARINGRVRWK